ncbi:gamma-glutamyltransferase [Bacillus sp. FJAT-50079]|uniref:gamma-glutamyltransferase n=1 Tax=Bacillus sp. FJAT-50079 TaxID=2833577 RepID=UPI001BC8E887|nr:gamma-glutamyltransferase [Bacillus sp. FJAT-50079]MBS4206727.1 gamma-glutamyltransferase [Bacillus sp. FJAT-50079]
MKRNWIYMFLALIVTLAIGYYFVQPFDTQENSPIYKKLNVFESSKGGNEGYGVSASNSLAVKIGMDILAHNGNAVDAAIAISYVLGVVEPYGSGLGGGGGMLILPGDKDKSPTFIDYREMSPTSSSRKKGAIGIPGFVKGMEFAHEKYGVKNLAELIDPSIELAEKGFRIQKSLTDRLAGAQSRLSVNKLPQFFPEGSPIQPDEWLKQPELAETLKLIKAKGSDVFYRGEIAEALAHEVSGITVSDLKNYSVFEKEPVYGEFSGFEVISAPPPFSGITLIQSLQMAEMLSVKGTKGNTSDYIHLTGEISKRAYKDRIQHIGDPEFVKIPIKKLTKKEYSEGLSKDISLDELSNHYEMDDHNEEHTSTTHFVVTDKEGTVVSVTNTLSNFFGTGKNVGGFFLNNNLENFNETSGSPNKYEPGKRSRTFTTPTILRNDEQIIGVGTPGGRRIPMMLTEVLVRHLLFDEPLQEAIDAPRFYVEDNHIQTEIRYPKGVQNELKKMGYKMGMNSYPIYYGGIQALVIDKKENVIYGGTDSRREGTWKVK